METHLTWPEAITMMSPMIIIGVIILAALYFEYKRGGEE